MPVLIDYFLISIILLLHFVLIFFLIRLSILLLKKDYKRSRRIILFIIGYVFLSIMLLYFDIGQSEKNLEPIFAFKTATIKDGGSAEYIGIGYKIKKYHSLYSKIVDGNIIEGIDKGYNVKLLYFIEVKEKIIFVPYE